MSLTSRTLVATAALVAFAAGASAGPIKPSQMWTGSVDDETLAAGAPAFVADAKTFAKLWADWKLEGKAPEVDFTKNLVVLTTSRGSKLNLVVNLGDDGDLKVGGFGTKDLRPGFRYVLGVVPREGVKTVNGKDLPKE